MTLQFVRKWSFLTLKVNFRFNIFELRFLKIKISILVRFSYQAKENIQKRLNWNLTNHAALRLYENCSMAIVQDGYFNSENEILILYEKITYYCSSETVQIFY